jgi:acyl-CoA reductase-like NAD-dependent aldehyde dehydrogenase
VAWIEAEDPAETNGEEMSVTTTASKVYQAPGHADSPVEVKPRYENFIGGHWVPPVQGQYMQDLSPANARKFTEVPRSTEEDIELALDAAHASREAWGETSLTERARVLNRIADVIEEHTEELAVAESWDNGKPVRMGRAIKAGRVWTNCYHQYPAGAAFGGYKMSGVGRELYRETLTEHYSQTKSLLVSYSDQALGLF